MKVRIVVDTSCDLQPGSDSEFAYVPFEIKVGDVSFHDDEKTQMELLLLMKEESTAAKSSCPSPAAFLNTFTCDAEVIFVVTISSNLSGSYNSAKIAKEIYLEENPDKDIFVVDSLSASAGETAIAYYIQDALEVERFQTMEELFLATKAYAKTVKTLFVLEDLSNLVKNGRMGKLAGLFAAFLHIKPVLGDDGNGEIVLYKKSRGTKKALRDLMTAIEERGKDLNLEDRILYISHCNAKQKALQVKALAEGQFSFAEIKIFETNGLSTVYAGDGGIVLAF
ncbi:DegV family protein [Gottschalkiaceae bacterium SANA]|nr:DegV family protein [Gottschalkiaceae bacterium SANA]